MRPEENWTNIWKKFAGRSDNRRGSGRFAGLAAAIALGLMAAVSGISGEASAAPQAARTATASSAQQGQRGQRGQKAHRAADFSWPDLSGGMDKLAGSAAGKKQRQESQKDAALIVGIEDYAFVDDVRGARLNAEDWWSYFRKVRGIGRTGAKLLRDKEGTREKILREAQEVASRVGPGGTLWFVFVGHGVASADGEEGMLVGADAQGEADSLDARSIRQSELEKIFRNSQASKVMLVLDACFSGKTSDGRPLAPGLQALVRTSQAKVGAGDKIVRMTAGKSDQFSGPLPGGERPAFSYLLLGALYGWGDADSDGRVTAREAVDYAADVLDSLEHTRRQTPELTCTSDNGEIVLAAGGHEKGPDIDRLVISGFGGSQPQEAPSAEVRPSETERAESAPQPMPAPSPSLPQQAEALPPPMPPAPPPVMPPPQQSGRVRTSAAHMRGPRVPIPAVSIPGGQYIPNKSVFRHDYAPRRIKDFRLALTPVTVAQYRECVDQGACRDLGRDGAQVCSWSKNGTDEHPIDCVTLADSEAFCRWAGGRLPSEAEWEYAATHDGTHQRRTEYPWGDEKPFSISRQSARPKAGFANFSTYKAISNGTTPVGSYPKGASPLGIVDLVGNVTEIVSPGLRGEKFVFKGGGYRNPEMLDALSVGYTFYTQGMSSGLISQGMRCAWDGREGRSGHMTASQKRALSEAESKGLSFVRIPGGRVRLGGRNFFTGSFEMMKSPVTVSQFERCIATGACQAAHYRTTGPGGSLEGFCNLGRGERFGAHPVNCVDRDGAEEFCRSIGARLPTASEWRYAAGMSPKGYKEHKFPWGDIAGMNACKRANAASGSAARPKYCFGKSPVPPLTARGRQRQPVQIPIQGIAALPSTSCGTTAVGFFSPDGDSALGLTDMTGSVAEWTIAPGESLMCSSGECAEAMGGSWLEPLMTLDGKILNRSGSGPAAWPVQALLPNLGFRCVRD